MQRCTLTVILAMHWVGSAAVPSWHLPFLSVTETRLEYPYDDVVPVPAARLVSVSSHGDEPGTTHVLLYVKLTLLTIEAASVLSPGPVTALSLATGCWFDCSAT